VDYKPLLPEYNINKTISVGLEVCPKLLVYGCCAIKINVLIESNSILCSLGNNTIQRGSSGRLIM